MTTLRSVAVFATFYGVVLLDAVPLPEVPGLKAVVCLAAGFLMAFPVDRVRALLLWVTESVKLAREYNTCVIASPRLKPEQREWRYIGRIKETR